MRDVNDAADATTAAVCPICARGVASAGVRSDDRYGYPGGFTLLRCPGCGHLRLEVAMSAEETTRLYTTYYPRSGFDVDAWAPASEEPGWRIWWSGLRASAFRWVPRNVRVLDIGCGFGESLGYHRNRGCDAYGVEADENILRVARRYDLNVRCGLFDGAVYAPNSFDVVTLDQVIEHVPDPAVLLRDIERVLRPGGTLIVSTPNVRGWGALVFGRRWIHWHAPYHQQFFTRNSMRKAAASAGLTLSRIQTVTNSAWLGFQWCHLVAPAARGQPSPFWSRKAARSAFHRFAFRCSAVMDRLQLNALLTRVFDAFGVGDNFVFVLRKTPR